MSRGKRWAVAALVAVAVLGVAAGFWWAENMTGVTIAHGPVQTLDPQDLVHPGDHRVRVVDDHRDALMTRLQLIADARETIDISSYIWRNDRSGRAVFAALLAAARRGVRVRLLGDGIFFQRDLGVARAMAGAHPDLALRYYNLMADEVAALDPGILDEVLTEFASFNHRMHIKVLIIDRQRVLLGGRNIGDEYFGLNQEYNFIDRDVVVTGPLVDTARKAFAVYWHSDRSVDPRTAADMAVEPAAIDWSAARIEPDPAAIGERWYRPERAAVVFDPLPASDIGAALEEPQRCARALGGLIRSTQRQVAMETPYVILSGYMQRLFSGLRSREQKPAITVWTNSLAAAVTWHGYVGFQHQLPELVLELGFDIRLQQPQALRELATDEPTRVAMHSKTFLVDDRWAAIGSYNLDPRSGRWNSEILLIVDDHALTSDLQRDFARRSAVTHNWVVARRRDPDAPEPEGWAAQLDLPDGEAIQERLGLLRRVSCFALDCDEPVPPGSPRFYECYRDVGLFPEVGEQTRKNVFTRLLAPVGDQLAPVL
ncbi:MAG: phospholipase D family protein [Planctomycetota bacterium]